MKLKKIASLALAGILAVSMLAGCANGTGNNNDGGVDVNPGSTSIVNAVNDGQSAANDVKITFTSDSDLQSALEKAIAIKGLNANAATLKTTIQNLLAEDYVQNLWNANTRPESYKANDGKHVQKDLDGESQTYLQVYVIANDKALNEKAAMKVAADEIDAEIAKLAERTANVTSGKKYYVYGYEGSVVMVSATKADGTTNYYVAGTVTQTATEKKA